MRDIKPGLRRGSVNWRRKRVHDNSLIADEVWERLRDQYVFRCQISTCVRHLVRLMRRQMKGTWSHPRSAT